MANDVTTTGDDDFSATGPRRVRNFARWNDKVKWVDRDGVAMPSPVLVLGCDELVRRWVDKVPEDIYATSDRPLPDPEELNAMIPMDQWDKDPDGKPKPPWAHYVSALLVDPTTAESFLYTASTIGAHMAVDGLNEAVLTMRRLRDDKCVPLVELTERPMKMKYQKNGLRPHFKIVDWKLPGGRRNPPITKNSPPQISGPATPAAPPQEESEPTKASKPTIDIAGTETLGAMSSLKPVTSSELMNDDIPFAPST
jgi:hypothetical protein